MPRIVHLLSVISSALFLVILPFRVSQLRLEKYMVISNQRGYGKLTIAIVLLALQLIHLLAILSQRDQFNVGTISTVLTFLAGVGLCPLLFLEHTRSIKPSDLAVVYLLASLLCNSVEVGIAIHDHAAFVTLFSTAAEFCIKFVLLIAESQGKAKILRGSRDQWSPEQISGILNRTFFWWINPVLAQGRRMTLTGDALPLMDPALSSKLLRKAGLRTWDQRAKPENKLTLPKVLAASLLSHFLAPVFPRLFLIIFRYAQPVLISNAIRYISQPSNENSKAGYMVILMAIIVYVGLAISKGVYQHLQNRLKIMIRGSVVGLINNKSLSQHHNNYDDGRAVALMSTDAENVGQSAQFFHETWAQVIEVVVGTVLLAKEVGWISPVPLVIIFFCSRMSRYLAKNLQSKQKNWNEATQKRLAMTASMINSMKGLKMLGITKYVETLVVTLRLQELDAAKTVRWMMVAYNASANALGIFSPIITFVLFVLVARWNGSVLDTETAFTTTALLGLVTHPANMIMSTVPQAIGSLAAFERIQQYLLEPSRQDQRTVLAKISESMGEMPAISIEDMTIQPMLAKSPILKDVNIVIAKGSLLICSGPVGSGKTVLANVILGELPPSTGRISISSKRIGSCVQQPWLPSGTIEEAICGFSSPDASWYEQVVQLCCLDDDIVALPNGDQSMIGSRGINLSGGQRQRVALARVLYARCEIVVLDDGFSALDGKTEGRIVESLLGPTGHFKKMGTTVFFITSATQHFHLADSLVILEDASVKYQGTWMDLALKPEHIPKITVNTNHETNLDETIQVNRNLQNQNLKVADAILDLSRGTGDASLYGYYIQSTGYQNFLLLLTCTASYSFFITFPQYWLKWWTEAPPNETMFYVGGYLILSLFAWAATNGSMWSTNIRLAPNSGTELHRRLLSTIIGAPLSYFSVTDAGTILNRFSQDIQLVDRQLPQAVLSISNQTFKLFIQTILLFSAQKMMSLTLPLCMVTIYIVQKIYLRTSRQLRLLELESQSAVYSSFLESVEGLATIRSFGWEREIEKANIACLDKSQKPLYILFCLQRWLNIVLDLMVAAIATGVITLAVVMKGTTSGGEIGMALNIVLVANTTLLGLVESWTNLEISLGAIARLKNLEAETPKEDKASEDFTPADNWPSTGTVDIDDVTVAYNSESLALKNVTMNILPGQQLAICGRTGSGKSTLLLTLLRLLDNQSGTIKVDGVDLSLVPRTLIRQRCFITVAQDALVLGQATLRFNLDPSSSLTDRNIIEGLQRTGLWSHFTSGNPEVAPRKSRQILETSIAQLPQMSTGQSQLFALTRAILQLQVLNKSSESLGSYPELRRIKPILLLDEATSSLDRHTESVMKDIIREEFTEKDHTVIAITHRLDSLREDMRAGKDIIVLMAKGKVDRIGSVEDVLGVVLST